MNCISQSAWHVWLEGKFYDNYREQLFLFDFVFLEAHLGFHFQCLITDMGFRIDRKKRKKKGPVEGDKLMNL